jgi:hypothetical protein
MMKKDHTVGESLRYWKNRDFRNMTLSTIDNFELAFREYDRISANKLSWEREQEHKPKWDFNAERQEFLRTGVFVK